MKILIAEDDSVTRRLLRSAVAKMGHDVTEAANGLTALAAWEELRHPLIISDWLMPDLDGLELCRRVRRLSGTELTYIILLTSRSGGADYLEAMEAGADDFLSKPFDKGHFAARVRVAERILALHTNLCLANATLEDRVTQRTADLEKALAAKSELLSRASHELRTPMNHVLGFAQLLDLDPLNPGQKECVDQILVSGDHLLKLIDRILQVSVSESGDLSFLDTIKDTANGQSTEPVTPGADLASPLNGSALLAENERISGSDAVSELRTDVPSFLETHAPKIRCEESLV